MTINVWLDIDGVVLDYTTPFLEHNGLAMTVNDIHHYDLTKLFGSRQECLDLMEEFAGTEEFANLPLIDNKIPELVSNLKAAGCSVYAITQVDYPVGVQPRIDNLSRVFKDDLTDVVITKQGEDKLKLINNLVSTSTNYLIEDNPSLLIRAYRFPDIITYGVARPYNIKESKEFKKLKKYADTVDCLKDILKEVK
jgi:hypothetical protein